MGEEKVEKHWKWNETVLQMDFSFDLEILLLLSS